MIRRNRFRSAALACILALAAAKTARALTITPIFDSSITGDANAATIEASINQVIGNYETLLLSPIHITVTFKEMATGLGESNKFIIDDSYTDFRAKLAASATSASDTTALNSLPIQSLNPVNSDPNIQLTEANALALGIYTGSNTNTSPTTISLNTSLMNLSRGGTQSGSKYDLLSVVSHEMDEILGLGSAIPNGTNPISGSPTTPTGAVQPEDLFRYSAAGVRSYNNGTPAQTTSYFSIDGGVTNIVGFNQNSTAANGADFGDWVSSGTSRVQDAFGTQGAVLNLGPAEKTALDVVGYTLLTSLTWNPTGGTAAVPPDGAGTWTTASGSVWWNGASNAVWTNSATPLNAQFGTPGTFSAAAFTVTLGSAITVGTVTFANANYTVAGGGNSLTINNGILALVNATISAPIILGAANTWETAATTVGTVTTPATLTVTGNISGGFGITKQGPGTLVLSGSNSYTGATTVAFGTLQLNSAGAIPSGNNIIVSGGAFDINGRSPSVGNLSFGDGNSTTAASVIDSAVAKGVITLGGDISFTGTNASSAFPPATISANLQLASGTHHITTADGFTAGSYDIVISGAMSGTGGITKDGINNTALTGANTYQGATVINNGFFYAAATNTLSTSSAVTVTSPGVLSLNPINSQTGVTPGSYSQSIGSLAGSGQVQMGSATLTVGNDNTSTTYSGAIFGTGGNLTKIGTGTLILSGNSGYTGVTTINGGILQLGDNGSSAGAIVNSSGITGTASGTLQFNRSSGASLSVPIGGAVNVVQASSGSYFLLANNTYTGTTTINSGATLVIGSAGGTVGTLGSGATTDNGALQFQRGDSLIVSSSISGSGTLSISQGGTIIFTGSNAYLGQTSITSSSMQIGNGGTTGSLTSSSTIAGFGTGATLIFNRSDALTVGNFIANPLSVVQNGTGTTTLTNANNYSGGTTVNAGTLLVSGSISGTTTVNSTGTFGGTGTTTGAVNVASGGTVLPGSSTGSGLLKTGNASFVSGSHFSLELGGTTGTNTAGTTYSELNVTGTVSLAGDVQISLFGGYTPHVNDTFIVILNDGSDAISGGFSNAPTQGSTFSSNGATFQVSYTANGDGGGTNNDVSLTVISVVPEPGTGLLALAGLSVLAGWRRGRRAV